MATTQEIRKQYLEIIEVPTTQAIIYAVLHGWVVRPVTCVHGKEQVIKIGFAPNEQEFPIILKEVDTLKEGR